MLEAPVEPRSQLGLYRAHLTSPEHRSHITVGRAQMLADTLEILRKNIGRKARHHQVFIAPRGSGKTHFLSLIEDAIHRDPALSKSYVVVRFPEEARRILSFADFLLMICEVLRDSGPPDSEWGRLHDRLATVEDDATIIDTVVPALRRHYQEHHQVFVLMVENLNQVMEEQIKKPQSIKALRGFLMQDNGCLLIGTSPLHFGGLTQADQPFYDFFDLQVLDQLSTEESIELIRRNLEWDKRTDLLAQFATLRPRLQAIHTLTGGSPRLTVMLYELLSNESITAVKQQFLMLLDRITPFYQDRLNDLSPQERVVLETIATMRDQWGKPAPPKTPANIARLMRMKQSQVSVLLGRLAKGLYLVQRDNPADARSSLYVIREGFFDLWLAMNISRAARQRIPLLTDFFAAFYEQLDARQQKKDEYWARLKAGEFNEDAAETLSYLSEVGPPEERAIGKAKLAAELIKRGETERPELLKRELQMLPLDSTARWITDRLDETEPSYLDELLELIQCWETQRQGGVEAFAQELQSIGEKLDLQGWSKLRMEFLRDHLETLPLTPERVMTRLQLANFLRKFAQWQEAACQGKTALDEAVELQGQDLIATACNDYALLLHDTNRLAEAEPLMRRALALNEARFSADHPFVSAALNNLALLLQDTDRLAEAEPLMRRALAIEDTGYAAGHPNVAIRLNNLAMLLHKSNRQAEAEPLMRRALAIDEASYGAGHPNVAIRLNNLARLLHDTDRLAEAEPLMRRALAIDEANFGKDHPKVALRLNNLAQLLQATDRLAEAEPMMRRALAIDEASYGVDHPKVAGLNPKVAIRLNNLARLLQDTHRLKEAEPLMCRALDIFVSSLGKPHPNTQTAASNYQRLLQATGLGEEEALAKVREVLGE